MRYGEGGEDRGGGRDRGWSLGGDRGWGWSRSGGWSWRGDRNEGWSWGGDPGGGWSRGGDRDGGRGGDRDRGQWGGDSGWGWGGADHRLLAALRAHGRRPVVAAAARGLSAAGEHAALWLATGLTAAALDPPRRAGWLHGTALVAAAHLTGMGVKRMVRRPRPRPETYAPLVRTAGRHSFPSCHACSAAAAAVAFTALHPPARHLAVPAAAVMCLARLVAGVHYPTDVAAGALLGAATAAAGRGRLRAVTEGRRS